MLANGFRGAVYLGWVYLFIQGRDYPMGKSTTVAVPREIWELLEEHEQRFGQGKGFVVSALIKRLADHQTLAERCKFMGLDAPDSKAQLLKHGAQSSRGSRTAA
jgi:hypothetical protein